MSWLWIVELGVNGSSIVELDPTVDRSVNSKQGILFYQYL